MSAQDRGPARGLEVVGVSDGDTIVVREAGGPRFKIRLSGIHAPKSRQPFGPAAKEALAELVMGRLVLLTQPIDQPTTDRYRRTLGWIFLTDERSTSVNIEMVRRGFAWKFTRYDDRASELKAAEQEARNARRGLWRELGTATPPVAPWEWRKG